MTSGPCQDVHLKELRVSDLPARPLSELGLNPSRGGNVRCHRDRAGQPHLRARHAVRSLPGSRVHGAEYIATALARGARAILTDRAGGRIAAEALAASDAALVLAEDPRAACRGRRRCGSARNPVMAAVTGTNGKTSVASFTRQLWAALGHEAANLGTTGVEGAYSAPWGTPRPTA